jgi:hypothetical protein
MHAMNGIRAYFARAVSYVRKRLMKSITGVSVIKLLLSAMLWHALTAEPNVIKKFPCLFCSTVTFSE